MSPDEALISESMQRAQHMLLMLGLAWFATIALGMVLVLRKNINPFAAFLLLVCLGPIGLLFILAARPRRKRARTQEQYYLSSGQRVIGPFLFDQVRELWKAGQVTVAHQICVVIKGRESAWEPVSAIAGELSEEERGPNLVPAICGGILLAAAVLGVAYYILTR